MLGLTRIGVTIPDHLLDAAILTDYAVSTRYPGWGEEVTAEEYQNALKLAEQLVGWAKSEVDSKTKKGLVGREKAQN